MFKRAGGFFTAAGTFIRGMAIGVAQIIPGVSGGTLALIMGIYERFIGALNAVSSAFMAFLSWLKGFKKEKWMVFQERVRAVEWAFLVLLAAGMFVAILATSGLITWLLEDHQTATYGLFFGLIIASVIVPWGKMKRRALPELAAFLIGLVLLLWISGLGQELPHKLDGKRYRQALAGIQAKEAKQKIFLKAYSQKDADFILNSGLTANEKETVGKILQQGSTPALLFLFLAGAISISAMILPGLSGSFVLLIMGCYGYIVGLINLLKKMDTSVFLPLFIFGLGMVVGLFSFAKLMDFLLKKYHSITMAFLIGLMLGSLRKIFPFRAGLADTTTAAVIVAILIGIGLVVGLHRASKRMGSFS